MIAGIGVDLCSISRVEEALASDYFRDELFSAEEIAYAESKGAGRFGSYAACVAAREAFIKASGFTLSAVMFSRNFELVHDLDGAPAVKLSGDLAARYPENNAQIFVSISHEGDYACAMVVIEKINDEVIVNGNSYA